MFILALRQFATWALKGHKMSVYIVFARRAHCDVMYA